MYYEPAGDKFWDNAGQPVYSYSDTLVCTKFYKELSVEDMLDGMTVQIMHNDTLCITIHYVAKPIDEED